MNLYNKETSKTVVRLEFSRLDVFMCVRCLCNTSTIASKASNSECYLRSQHKQVDKIDKNITQNTTKKIVLLLSITPNTFLFLWP